MGTGGGLGLSLGPLGLFPSDTTNGHQEVVEEGCAVSHDRQHAFRGRGGCCDGCN